jgi:hypothetical protein
MALYVKEQTLTDIICERTNFDRHEWKQALSFLSVCMRNIPTQYCDIVSYLPSPWRVTSYCATSDTSYVTFDFKLIVMDIHMKRICDLQITDFQYKHVYFVYCVIAHLLQGSVMEKPLYKHNLQIANTFHMNIHNYKLKIKCFIPTKYDCHLHDLF